MAIGFVTTLRNSRLDAISAAVDAGAGAGLLRFYDAPKPATGAAITTQTLLAELTFSNPCAPAASNGVLTFSAITQDSSANASGTAAWARVVDSTGAIVMDIDVETSAGSNKIVLNTASIVIGGPVSVTSFVLTEGNA